MKNIKLILTDIDGTLLDNQKKCPAENAEAITSAHQQGILFGFVSGRPALNLVPCIQDWNLDTVVDIIIGSNGAEIYYVKEKKLEKVYNLDSKTMISLEKKTRNMDVSTCFYEGMTLVANKLTETYIKRCQDMNFTQKTVDFEQYIQTSYPKMLLINPKGKQEAYIKEASSLGFDHLKFVSSSPILIEIIDKRLSKSEGIQRILKHYNFKNNEILCFGDADNDYEMIRDFPSVAMENGSEKILNTATYQTCSNQDAGVGKFINSHILYK